MKKNKNKPTDQQEKHHADQKPMGTSVDWDIPGDVPEAHRRSVHPYAPTVNPDSKQNSSDAPANTGTSDILPDERPHSSVQAQTSNTRSRGSSFPLRWLIVLLLMLGLGGLGYFYSAGNDENLVAANIEQADVNENAVIEGVDTAMQKVMSDAAEKMAILPEQVVEPEIEGNAEEAAGAIQEPHIITHVVKKGDTLWDIAEKYVNDPFRYPELAELSNIQNPDLIYPGDIVRIRI